MSSLKNPFGEKNGKLILISDISPKARHLFMRILVDLRQTNEHG